MKSESRLIYADSERNPNLWYESGFHAPDPFLWFEIDGQASIVVSPLEVGRAVKEAKPHVNVISTAEARERWNLNEQDVRQNHTLIAAISASENVHKWLVPNDFPFGLAKQLLASGLELDTLSPFSPNREAKSPQEVQCIKRAIHMTQQGIERAYEILRAATIGKDDVLFWNGDVLTAEQLGAEINIAIARLGGTAADTITAPGPQGADPHCQGFGPIRAHQPIVMDVFPRDSKTGYFGDLTRTVVKGSAPDVVQRAFHTVHQAQLKAIDMLKPGIAGAEPHNAVVQFFKEQGYATNTDSVPATGFFHGLGHSIGLEIHESPSLSPRNEKPLVEGNVVTVEPGLYYPEWGGIRIEDDVLITADGAEKLSNLPVFLEL